MKGTHRNTLQHIAKHARAQGGADEESRFVQV